MSLKSLLQGFRSITAIYCHYFIDLHTLLLIQGGKFNLSIFSVVGVVTADPLTAMVRYHGFTLFILIHGYFNACSWVHGRQVAYVWFYSLIYIYKIIIHHCTGLKLQNTLNNNVNEWRGYRRVSLVHSIKAINCVENKMKPQNKIKTFTSRSLPFCACNKSAWPC